MMNHPTLAELRRRVFKHSHQGADRPEIGNILARRWGRPAAVYGTWLAIRLGLSAHQVTVLALLANAAGALCIGSGGRLGFVAGVGMLHLGFWLDHVDGQVARWRGTAGLSGTYLDYLMHHLANLTLGFALGFGLAARTGELRWAVAGFLIGAGWAFLGLHNDCRYKAFFQRLKASSGSYRVDGGSRGERSAPPTPWPRRGRGLLTWPAYKANEPHVVLIALSILAVAACCAPAIWLMLWRWGVGITAALAPLLAIARTTRAVRRDTVGVEFQRWFQPDDPAP